MARSSKRRKKKDLPESGFSKAKKLIRRSGNALRGFEAFKYAGGPSDFRDALPKLFEIPAYRSWVWPPKHFDTEHLSLGNGLRLSASPEANIAWIAETLMVFTEELSALLQLQEKLERMTFNGKLEELEQVLSEIDRISGVSLRTLEQRLLALSEKQGASRLGEFFDERLRDSSSLAKYLLFWAHYRSEPKITATNFHRSIEKELTENRSVYALAKLYLGGHFESEEYNTIRYIGLSDMFPLADRFHIFKLFLANYVASGRSEQELSEIAGAIRPLVEKVEDRQLNHIFRACGGRPKSSSPKDIAAAWSAYSKGSYAQCLRTIEGLAANAPSIDSIVLAIRAEAQTGEVGRLTPFLEPASPAAQIYEELPKILFLEADAADAFGRLRKLALVNSGMRWSSELQAELEWATSDARIELANHSLCYHTLLSGAANPKTGFILEQIRSGAGRAFFDDEADLLTGRSLRCVIDDDAESLPKDLAKAKNLKLSAVCDIRHGRPEHALQKLDELEEEGLGSIEDIDLDLLKIVALTKISDWQRSALLAGTLLLRSSFAASALPIFAILKGSERNSESLEQPNPEHLGQLSVMVLADFAAKFLGGSQELRIDAFEDLLAKEGVRKPSDLIDKRDQFEPKMIDYFLAKVCSPDLLDQCLDLEKTEDVENERAALIVALTADDEAVELSAEEVLSLERELQTIRMRQAVRDTQRQLNQSKIYVNIDGIKNALRDEMIENWNRYRVIILKSETNISDFEKDLLDRFKGDIFLFTAKDKQAIEFLGAIIVRIANEFSLSKEFGLNSNLSTNVRHGSIMRELRGPFTRQRVVTNKETEESEYSASELVAELPFRSTAGRNRADSIVKELSSEIDRAIQELNDELLRIKSDQYPSGLFDYSIPDSVIIRLHTVCRSISDYDEFLSTIIDWLWARTEDNLLSVQDALHSRVRTRIEASVNEALRKADQLPNTNARAEFSRHLALSQGEFKLAVDRVVDWFTRAKDQAFADYMLSVAFEAGCAMVEPYYADLKITNVRKGDWAQEMPGWTLPAITKLFSLLVENAAKHAGFQSGMLRLTASVEFEDNQLTIIVSNPLGETVNLEAVSAKAEEITRDYRREKAADAVALEGGSGYAKIWNLLEHDLKIDHVIETRVREGMFEVVLMMGLAGAVQ